MSFGKRPQPPLSPGMGEGPLPAGSVPSGLETAGPVDYGRCAEPAKKFLDMLMAAYGTKGGRVHAETILGAAAALTGEFALRSTRLPLPAKGLVFGDAINEVLYEGAESGRATIWSVFSKAALEAGVAKSDLPDIVDIFTRVAAAVGSSNFPPLSVPKQNFPHEWSPNATPRLRHKVVAIADGYDLSLSEIAFALAMTTAMLMTMTKEVLSPVIAIRLVTEITFAVAKMAPLTEPITT